MDGIDTPIAGYYRTTLVRGGPLVGVRIWHGPPLEPWTREEMDRAPRWNAEVNGQHEELERVWPKCLRDPIDEEEYRYFAESSEWARRNDGFDPAAAPKRKTNWDDSSAPDFGAAA